MYVCSLLVMSITYVRMCLYVDYQIKLCYHDNGRCLLIMLLLHEQNIFHAKFPGFSVCLPYADMIIHSNAYFVFTEL